MAPLQSALCARAGLRCLQCWPSFAAQQAGWCSAAAASLSAQRAWDPCAGDGEPRAGRCVRSGGCRHAAGAAGFIDGHAQRWVAVYVCGRSVVSGWGYTWQSLFRCVAVNVAAFGLAKLVCWELAATGKLTQGTPLSWVNCLPVSSSRMASCMPQVRPRSGGRSNSQRTASCSRQGSWVLPPGAAA